MKKFTLTLMALLCFAGALIAQNHVTTLNGGEVLGIPGVFTNDGHSNVLCYNYDIDAYCIHDNDLTTVLLNVSSIFNTSDEIVYCYYTDFSSADGFSGYHSIPGEKILYFTQSLFNADNYYEYIIWSNSGWTISSSDGTIIQTINVDDGCQARRHPFIMKIDDNFFLGLIESNNETYDENMLVYRIDKVQGLTKIDMQLPISVFPTMPTREEQITVELGEGTNATEITVVNSLGQVVKRLPVEEGQCTVTIPARDLGSGLNVVNTRSNKGQGSCKIIVR